MTAIATLDSVIPQTVSPNAVVWIDGRRAMVVLMSHTGGISTCEITRGWLDQPSYLAHVVRVIGDRPRVVILGPSSVRLALEREYVTIFHRPDRLVDVEPAGVVDMADLIDRSRVLAG
jgi:hypothetical protein